MGLGDFLASGAGVFTGGLIDTGVSAWNAIENRKQSEKFMRNKHQWEVADLRAAGLNPILSAGNSAGGSPGGGAIQSNLSSSAKEALLLDESVKKLKNENENLAADKWRIYADQDLKSTNANLNFEMEKYWRSLRKKVETEHYMLGLQVPALEIGENAAASLLQQKWDKPPTFEDLMNMVRLYLYRNAFGVKK